MAEATPVRNVFFIGIEVDSMGGSQRVLHTLAQGMGERGHRVELIGIRPSPDPFPYNSGTRTYQHSTLYTEPNRPKPKARTVGERFGPARRAEGRRARAERDRARRELTAKLGSVRDGYIVFGSPWAVDWTVSLDWGRLKGIGQYHESFAQARRGPNLGLIKRHYPKLEKTLVLSQGDAVEFRNQRVPNVRVMPNPLPFVPDSVAPLDTRKIGAVGRFDPIKRYDRLIESFAAAVRSRPGWELHLFGEGPLEAELKQTAAQLGVAGQVFFRGTTTDMAAAYRELSLLALSSEREGWGMVLAEAAACGVPCVSFDMSSGVRELIAHGRTGTLVPPADVPALAEALGELMDDNALRARYGAAGRDHVATWSLPKVLDRWDRVFEEIER
ncbi:glycosyltransferase [Streptomyces sp. NPDC051561]|uniref:glycosyltransferase n=1 Tax=Streptomyces sp. NPDC051561 TaxID=3365658 RepID=UPI0037B2A2FE